MAADDAIRAQSTQATGRRWSELRRLNYEDPIGPHHPGSDLTDRPGVVTVHEEFSVEADADMTDEGTANWGRALRVVAFDRLTLLLSHIAGTTTTAVHVAVQVSHSEGASADWFDLHSDEAGDGVLVRKVFDWSTTVDGEIAFSVPTTEARFMRFKVWADGANRSNSRATLYARRIMNSV